MTEQKLLNALALTKIPGLGIVGIKKLLDAMEDAESIFRHRKELAEIVPGVGERLMKALDCPEAFLYAEKELKFIQKNSIACLSLKDEAYPSRLRECDDAPSLLFFKGNAELNALRVVSIVGTRHITDYGNCLCRQFIADLQALCPNVLIVNWLMEWIYMLTEKLCRMNCLLWEYLLMDWIVFIRQRIVTPPFVCLNGEDCLQNICLKPILIGRTLFSVTVLWQE